MGPLIDLTLVDLNLPRKETLKWIDIEHNGEILARENEDMDDLVNILNPKPIINHRK